MRTQAEVVELIRHRFQEIGCDPADLLLIRPKDGVTWDIALTFVVTRKDGKQTKIYRRELDDGNEQGINNALRGFK